MESGIRNLQRDTADQRLEDITEEVISPAIRSREKEFPELGKRKGRKNIRIISDVQLVPPLRPVEDVTITPVSASGIEKRKESRPMEEEQRTPGRWSVVRGRRDRRDGGGGDPVNGDRLDAGSGTPRASAGARGSRGARGANVGIGGRLPKTAAVVIRSASEGASCYVDILRKARTEVPLGDIEMDSIRVREAANGGLVLEITGPEGGSRADLLTTRLRSVLGDDVTMSRPTKMGEVRLTGLDITSTAKEVRDYVATAGACQGFDVFVGMLRKLPNGLRAVWVQCPAISANKLATAGNKDRMGSRQSE